MEQKNALEPLVKAWLGVVEEAKKIKKETFGADAEECLRYYDGPYAWQWRKKYRSKLTSEADLEDTPIEPTFKMSVNKTAEFVQIFGPTLYHRNPQRKVTPNPLVSVSDIVPAELTDRPEMQALLQQEQAVLPPIKFTRACQSRLMETLLNYTPNELNLKDHIRLALEEAMIKGMGVVWIEAWTNPLGNQTLIGSFYDTVDNLYMDPDAETLDDAEFIIRRREEPVWRVADKFHLKESEVKGNAESVTSSGSTASMDDESYHRSRGATNDMVVYYEIYSRTGAGEKLTGAKDIDESLKDQLAGLGKYVYLAVANNLPYPLNLAPSHIRAAQGDHDLIEATSWPIAFWEDGQWPFVPVYFHTRPRSPWPIPHIKFGLGELKFLDWAYSFIASKIGHTCRDLIAVPKSLSEEMKDAILRGKDLGLIEIEELHGNTIKDIVSYLQGPQFNGDIFNVIQYVETNLEKRLGLNELAYGMASKQIRVAADAEIRQQSTQIRPTDMANRVEDAASLMARLEAIASRLILKSADIVPIMGPIGGMLWLHFIENVDETRVALELDYRVEAGQARKPNKEKEVQNMQTAMQQLLPVLLQTGNFNAANALIQDWAKSIDLLNPERYALQPPQPQPDAKAQLIEAQTQAVQQQSQLKMQLTAAQGEMKLRHGQQKLNNKLSADAQKHFQEMQQAGDAATMEMLQKLLAMQTDQQVTKANAVTNQTVKLMTAEPATSKEGSKNAKEKQ